MAKRTEQEEKQVEEVREFCQDNHESMRKMTKVKALDHLKCQFSDVALDIILKGMARWLKQNNQRA